MDKIYRRTQILAIVGSGTAATQTALRRKLAQRGIHVTQATVSRDIEELGLVKTREGYRLPDGRQPAAPPQPGLPVLLKEFLRDVRQAGHAAPASASTTPMTAYSARVRTSRMNGSG